MIFGFNQSSVLLDDESMSWIFDIFDWSLATFDFKQRKIGTQLIFPNNEHFPGKENTVEGMVALIFSQVKAYAGLASLPCELQNEHGISHAVSDGSRHPSVADDNQIVFQYHSHLLNDPEVLIASFIHQVAFYLISVSPTPPPGGIENRPHAAEILATCMGFGIIMANSANTQKIRSCGSCSGPAVERESFLSQYDITYALAIYCILNNVPVNKATIHLKKSLKAFYKKSYKEIKSNVFTGKNKLDALRSAFITSK